MEGEGGRGEREGIKEYEICKGKLWNGRRKEHVGRKEEGEGER